MRAEFADGQKELAPMAIRVVRFCDTLDANM